MDQIDQLRMEVGRSINTLRNRYVNTSDAGEKKAIKKSIAILDDAMTLLNQAGLLDAAITLTRATTALESAVAAARTGPFDGYLSALEGHLDNLNKLSGALHAREALPSAPEEGTGPATTARGIAAATRGLTRGLSAPNTSLDFNVLKKEYQAYYDACAVRPQYKANLAYYVKRLTAGQPAYTDVGKALDIPWPFVGVIHAMECGFNFAGHLHNGDPLTARTVHVPAGRPPTGVPPFTWRESAIDALTLKGYQHISSWTVPQMLYQLERYNGFGYRKRGLVTPYLWSFSNLYIKGKFVADGHFDPNAVSKQCGAALMLKAVL